MTQRRQIGRTPPARRLVCALAGALSLALVVSPASGGDSTFNPRVALTVNYTDNVAFLTGPSGEPDSDAADINSRLKLLLPYSKTMDRGSLDLAYETGYSAYQVYDNLNFLGHRGSLGYIYEPNRTSTLSLFTNLLVTQDQGNPAQQTEDDVDFFLTVPTERRYLDVGIAFSQQASKLWNWDITSSVTAARFSQVESVDQPDIPQTFEDKNAFRVAAGFARQLNRKISIGARYRFQFTDLEFTPDEKYHSLVLTLGRVFSRRTYLGFELGGYNRQRDESDNPDPQDFQDSGLYASINLGSSRPVGAVEIGFDVGVRPTTGGALAGTSTNATAAMFVNGATTRIWDWNFTARYTRRMPSDQNLPTTETASASGSLERGFGRTLGLSIFANLANQDIVGEDQGTVPGVTGSFFSAGIGLVWYPLGRLKIASGS